MLLLICFNWRKLGGQSTYNGQIKAYIQSCSDIVKNYWLWPGFGHYQFLRQESFIFSSCDICFIHFLNVFKKYYVVWNHSNDIQIRHSWWQSEIGLHRVLWSALLTGLILSGTACANMRNLVKTFGTISSHIWQMCSLLKQHLCHVTLLIYYACKQRDTNKVTAYKWSLLSPIKTKPSL